MRDKALGDIATRQVDDDQPYWDLLEGQRVFPETSPVLSPRVLNIDPVAIKGLSEILCNDIINESLFWKYPGNWIKPPITARNLDLFSDCAGVNLPAAAANQTVLLTFRVPDRHIALFTRFGQALEDATAFDDVEWEFAGTEFEPAYSPPYLGQIGSMLNPYEFPMPLLRKGGETITILARNTGAGAHTAFARLVGYLWAPKDYRPERYRSGAAGTNRTCQRILGGALATWVDPSAPAANFGGDVNMFIGSDGTRAFLRFPTLRGGCNKGAINNVFLRTRLLDATGATAAHNIRVRAPGDQWDESTLTFANQPQIIDDLVGETSLLPVGDKYIDITEEYKRWCGCENKIAIQPGGASGKDAYIGLNAPGTNFNNSLLVVTNDLNPPAGDIWRSLIQFDVSSIPPGSRVSSAFIELITSAITGTVTDFGLNIFPILGTWAEAAVTWNTQPDRGPVSAYGLLSSVANGKVTIDITDLVNQWVAGTLTNNGMMLEKAFVEPLEGTLTLKSSDNITAVDRPKLNVSFVGSTPCQNFGLIMELDPTGAFTPEFASPSSITPAFRPSLVIVEQSPLNPLV